MLVDRQICAKLIDESLRIVGPDGRNVAPCDAASGTPILGPDTVFDAHGIQLHVRKVFFQRSGKWADLTEENHVTLRPGDAVIVETYERLKLPHDMMASVTALARLSHMGLSSVTTTVHPGWGAGAPGEKDDPQPLLVAMFNLGFSEVELNYHQPFCRLVFFSASARACADAPTALDVLARFNKTLAPEREKEGALEVRRKRAGWGGVVVAILAAVVLAFFAPTYSALPIAVGALVFAAMRELHKL
jgi:hypothetical protein